MAVRIMFCDKGLNGIPFLPGALGQLIFIGQTPPDVGIGRKPAQQIIQVLQIFFVTHAVEAPAVIGVEQDQIDLNAHPAQTDNVPIQRIPESIHRAGRVPAAILCLLEGIVGRLVFVEIVVLGEDAHTDLVKRRFFQGLHGLLNEFVGLGDQRIHRSSEGMEQLAVFKAESAAIGLDHARMVGFQTISLAFRAHNTTHVPVIFSRLLGQKAHLVHTVAGVKTGNGLFFVTKGEFSLKTAAFRKIPEGKFKHFIFYHINHLFILVSVEPPVSNHCIFSDAPVPPIPGSAPGVVQTSFACDFSVSIIFFVQLNRNKS